MKGSEKKGKVFLKKENKWNEIKRKEYADEWWF